MADFRQGSRAVDTPATENWNVLAGFVGLPQVTESAKEGDILHKERLQWERAATDGEYISGRARIR